jgi:hypothetical protein
MTRIRTTRSSPRSRLPTSSTSARRREARFRSLPEPEEIWGHTLERLERFVSDKGIKLERHEGLRMVEGVSTGGTILLKASLAPAEEFSVLIHELSYEMLHQDPGNRAKERAVREAEAEAVAYVVCQGIGLDVNTASSDYIQRYDGDKKALMRSLERIQRTAAETLEAVTVETEGSDSTGSSVRVAVVA